MFLAACARTNNKPGETVLKFSGSALGAEGTLVAKQLQRFMQLHPGIRVELQRTPDDANQRHQLYVQWLNARVGNPDILQLDVVWTPEFAAAGWVLPLTRFKPAASEFFPATITANTWAGQLYALPWFADVGLLYRRTDFVPNEPRNLRELVTDARQAMARPGGPRFGIVWQGARYEGLITGFVEYLGAFGGRILDDSGRVVVNQPQAVRALQFMRDELYTSHIAPLDVLTWHEEEARFAFQNGNAVFMRNWPYPVAAMSDKSQSAVAGKFAVSPIPASGESGGHSTAALGGAQLAINAFSESPDAAYQLIEYLTAPEQMLERGQAVGQYPTRPALYSDAGLRKALTIPLDDARRAIESATPRPVTPIYTELSEILQIELHRALVRQAEPQEALNSAAKKIDALIERTGMRKLMAVEQKPAAPAASSTAGHSE
ncbi:MAG: Maltose/maltodextrin transporter, permease protein MalF [Gemmatimonadales bacterium]|nr:Maltose/maltodextrin transporter, permease protein MalF [Gemmatimonadales bacterium]